METDAGAVSYGDTQYGTYAYGEEHGRSAEVLMLGDFVRLAVITAEGASHSITLPVERFRELVRPHLRGVLL